MIYICFEVGVGSLQRTVNIETRHLMSAEYK